MFHKHYSKVHKRRIALYWILVVIAVGVGFLIGSTCHASEDITCWVVCKPGSHVDVHRAPDKNSQVEGRLDPCDSFLTDGVSKNGFIRVLNVGESADAWVYCGYVVTEKPEVLNGERYISVSRGKLYCRRWIGGPKVAGRIGYLTNCESVQVFYRTSEWSVTNRGYIKSEYLEADPE